jgi:CRP-like cAMP-binding protein/Fe-S-cluster-containing hydrogenase component 2
MDAQATKQEVEAALAQLRTYPFLAPLSEVVLRKLQPNLVERTYAANDVILRAGEYSDAAFYIKSGTVEVRFAPMRATSPGGNTPAHQKVTIEPGELVGELSALARYPVSSDVTAKSQTVCLVIRTPALRMLFKQKEMAEFKKQVDERYRARSLGSHLRQVELFSGLSDPTIERLRQTAEMQSFEPGAMIAEQGTDADGFLLVRGGNIKVMIRTGSSDLAVTYLRKGEYAGEAALLMDEPWPFSLQALEYVELVKIGRDEFNRIIGEHPGLKERLWKSTIAKLKERGAATRNPLVSQYLQMAIDTGLIHGESVLLIDLSTCTRCDDCVSACAETHGGTPRFIREGSRYQHWSVPVACYQCSDPVCLIGCPTGAITRAMGTLEVTIDPQTCIGCSNCVKRCPWHNIVEVPFSSPVMKKQINLATKCDLCVGRSAGPACVQMCPHGSAVRISFKDLVSVGETLSR